MSRSVRRRAKVHFLSKSKEKWGVLGRSLPTFNIVRRFT
jgi:hypothetical protein